MLAELLSVFHRDNSVAVMEPLTVPVLFIPHRFERWVADLANASSDFDPVSAREAFTAHMKDFESGTLLSTMCDSAQSMGELLKLGQVFRALQSGELSIFDLKSEWRSICEQVLIAFRQGHGCNIYFKPRETEMRTESIEDPADYYNSRWAQVEVVTQEAAISIEALADDKAIHVFEFRPMPLVEYYVIARKALDAKLELPERKIYYSVCSF